MRTPLTIAALGILVLSWSMGAPATPKSGNQAKIAQAPQQPKFDAKSIVRKGRALLDQKRLPDALNAFVQYSAMKPNDPEGYFWQGIALDELNMPAKSAEAFRQGLAKAQKLGMDSPEMWTNFGNALLKDGKVEDSITAYQKAIEIDPQLPPAHLNLARALLEAGKPEPALASLNTCNELRFGGPQQIYYRAKALKQLGRTEEAAAQVNQLLLKVPEQSQERKALLEEFSDILKR